MGQQLAARPMVPGSAMFYNLARYSNAQNSNIGGFGGNSNAQAPDLSQYLGFTTPQQMPNPTLSQTINAPMTLGFNRFSGFGAMPRLGSVGGSVGVLGRQYNG